MTTQERAYWKSQKGKACTVNYDPPSNHAVIVGIRLARSFSGHDAVVVRFADGSRLSVRPRQITEVQQ